MTIDYAALKIEYPKLKGALTRAKKKGPEAVIKEVARAYARFDEIGWPDGWATWQIAHDDAAEDIRRQSARDSWGAL